MAPRGINADNVFGDVGCGQVKSDLMFAAHKLKGTYSVQNTLRGNLVNHAPCNVDGAGGLI